MANVFEFGRVHQRTPNSLRLKQHGNMAESSEVQQQLQMHNPLELIMSRELGNAVPHKPLTLGGRCHYISTIALTNINHNHLREGQLESASVLGTPEQAMMSRV